MLIFGQRLGQLTPDDFFACFDNMSIALVEFGVKLTLNSSR